MGETSLKITRFVAVLGAVMAGVSTPASAYPLFGGYDCEGDCSDHASGYDWAERHDIYNPYECQQADSQAFKEGCQVRAANPLRGSDRDDAGQFIIKHEQFITPAQPK